MCNKESADFMGLFLQTGILKDCKLAQAETYIEKLSCHPNPHNIILAECRLSEQHGDVFIHFNDYCSGYGELAKDLSVESESATKILYIYDGDFWGYELYDKGEHVDSFNPIPEYFSDELDETEIQSCLGNSKVISRYFNVNEANIKNYLVHWTEELQEDRKAYEDDECGCEDWQMVDFLKKLGYTYEEEA